MWYQAVANGVQHCPVFTTCNSSAVSLQLTLKMTATEAGSHLQSHHLNSATSVTSTNTNSLSQDFSNLGDQLSQMSDDTPRFKPFTVAS